MFSLVFAAAVFASAGLTNGAALQHSRAKVDLDSNLFGRQDQQSCLEGDLIQRASALTGQEPGTKGIKSGQAASAVYVTPKTAACHVLLLTYAL